MVFGLHLLHMLRRRTTRTRFEQTAARHQRHDRQHLRRGAQLQDGEQVGVIVTQHIAGHRDRVLAAANPRNRHLGGLNRRLDGNVQASGVVIRQILLHQPLDVPVVGPLGIQPENRRHPRQPGPGYRELYPILDGGVLGLAGPPNIPSLDLMFDEHVAGGIHHLHSAVGRYLERLIVRTVFFRLLRHETHIRHRAHRGWIERAMSLAVVDDRLVHPGVGRIRDDRQGVLLLTRGIPHVPRGADHRRHRGIHNHVRWYMQVGDALIRIHHGQRRTIRQGGVEGRRDFRTIVQRIQADINSSQAVLAIEPIGQQHVTILIEHVCEIGAHNVAENHRIRHFHHRGL